jgi:pyrimidine-nucleoside phosphorylase
VGHLLALSDLGLDEAEGRSRAEAAIADGSAVRAYERWIRAQGGDPDEDALPTAAVVHPVPAAHAGYVAEVGASAIGLAALRLGAGRAAKDDPIDYAVGVRCLRKRGDAVEEGAPLAEVHARDDVGAATAVAEVAAAYRIEAEPPPEQPLLVDVVRA